MRIQISYWFWPASEGVTSILAGGIGGVALNVINNSGVDVISGCYCYADNIVRLYINRLIKYSGSSCHTMNLITRMDMHLVIINESHFEQALYYGHIEWIN